MNEVYKLITTNSNFINELETQFVNNLLVIRYIKALEAIRKFRQKQVGASCKMAEELHQTS